MFSTMIFFFLGIHVKFDVSQPVGQRVVDVKVRCSKCRIPKYEPLDKNKEYKVVFKLYSVVDSNRDSRPIAGTL